MSIKYPGSTGDIELVNGKKYTILDVIHIINGCIIEVVEEIKNS